MESWILLILGFVMAATAWSPPEEELSYKEAVSLAVNLYNQEPGVPLAFRLLEAKPQPEWDPLIQSPQELELTIKETTCPPSEQLDLDQCDFKDHGVVKECSGTIFPEQGDPVIKLRCQPTGRKRTRAKDIIIIIIGRVSKEKSVERLSDYAERRH